MKPRRIPKAPKLGVKFRKHTGYWPQIDDFAIVRCRGRFVIAVVASLDPVTACFGDIVVEVERGTAAIGPKQRFKPTAGVLIGTSYSDATEARNALDPHRK